ncbi:unnamed protein product [Toxocara canis]|uniref:protein-serine/threonine phosphatase n=1 Tax=Toxocara canis TaxID=6265 RepID=A0A3P7FBY5_TOXCA|nr:unnamed protein product [Toxocara canis]
MLRIYDKNGFPPETNYLFLGDFVDRGKQNIETITLQFCYKIKFPENFFMLRGEVTSFAKRTFASNRKRSFLQLEHNIPLIVRPDNVVLRDRLYSNKCHRHRTPQS